MVGGAKAVLGDLIHLGRLEKDIAARYVPQGGVLGRYHGRISLPSVKSIAISWLNNHHHSLYLWHFICVHSQLQWLGVQSTGIELKHAPEMGGTSGRPC